MAETIEPDKRAFEAWWTSVCLNGDPIRRPNLSKEAFMAGWIAGNNYAFEGVDGVSETPWSAP